MQRVGGMWCYGTIVYTSVIFVINIMIAIKTRYWVWVTHVTIWGTLLFYVILSYVYALWATPNVLWVHETNDPTYVFIWLSTTVTFWTTIIIVVTVCLFPAIIAMLVQHHLLPQDVDRIRDNMHNSTLLRTNDVNSRSHLVHRHQTNYSTLISED